MGAGPLDQDNSIFMVIFLPVLWIHYHYEIYSSSTAFTAYFELHLLLLPKLLLLRIHYHIDKCDSNIHHQTGRNGAHFLF